MSSVKSEQAFLEAYDAYAEAIFRHCYFRVYDREAARELSQEAFTRAWAYLAEGKEVKNIRALVYKIANNLIIDRARKKREASLEALQEAGFAPGTNRHEHEAKVDATLILDKFTLIEEDYREVVYMRYVDGLTPREIAAVTGLSVNVISVRVYRGIKKLQTLIKTDLD